MLLTDLMMPQTTGMDLLRAAKTIAPETEVVLMTAYGTPELANEALERGAFKVLHKPFELQDVTALVAC